MSQWKMPAVCMGPLEKHCNESRVISRRYRNVKNASNTRCVCHEHYRFIWIEGIKFYRKSKPYIHKIYEL